MTNETGTGLHESAAEHGTPHSGVAANATSCDGSVDLPSPPIRTFEQLGLKMEGCELPENDQKRFKNLVTNYNDVFALDNSEVTGCTLGSLHLRTKEPNVKPFRARV